MAEAMSVKNVDCVGWMICYDRAEATESQASILCPLLNLSVFHLLFPLSVALIYGKSYSLVFVLVSARNVPIERISRMDFQDAESHVPVAPVHLSAYEFLMS